MRNKVENRFIVIVITFCLSILVGFLSLPFVVLSVLILEDDRFSRGIELTRNGIISAFAATFICALIPWTIGAPMRWVYPSSRWRWDIDVTTHREKWARGIGCLNLLVPLTIFLGSLLQLLWAL